MKTLSFYFVLMGSVCFAQTDFKKNFPVSASKVSMKFIYPKLVRISTWDKDEIEIQASVAINLGKNDDAFEIKGESSESGLYIESEIRDYSSLPRFVVVKLDDREYYFEGENWKSPELQSFLEENKASNISWISSGVAKEIKLEIKVPKNIELSIHTRHGIIELIDLPKSVVAYSRHGGVDASVDLSLAHNFELQTRHGEIYTNLDLEYDENNYFNKSREIFVRAKYKGGGSKMVFESRHGNIYLRGKN